ncbi:hypothetical protein K525DRAFT_277313 [Schizophyllum commune Loenen D]|nr:hypothetical protein K525DRAFT_277313 [Schizophyllum commune Loenen D]
MPSPPSNSSAASQSPPMAFLPPAATTPDSASSGMDHDDSEERRKAVQRFMARAEISMVTRSLRTRLSYAAYKANHNVPHIPLNDLEAQSQAHIANTAPARMLPAKRKAGGGNYYNNPATQGGSAPTSTVTSLKRVSSGSMAPPSFTLAPRTYYPHIDGTSPFASDGTKPAGSSMNLYTSILAPPPAKQARTIFNAGDPPVTAQSRPPPSPRAGRSGKPASKSTAEGTRSHTRGRNAPSTPGRSKRPTKKSKKEHKGKTDETMDADVEAAATLTSIFMAHRGSIGSAGSPRSSVDGGTSEAGELASSQQPPGSATPRMVRPASSATTRPLQEEESGATLVELSGSQQKTPPPSDTPTAPPGSVTPIPAATDNEAADLMLYLATSPSPARPMNKDSKDAAAFRALSGTTSNTLRNKGRILFPTTAPSTGPDPTSVIAPKQHGPSHLSRGGESSFNATQAPGTAHQLGQPQPASMEVDEAQRVNSPAPPSGQLLPPPPLASSPSLSASGAQSPRPSGLARGNSSSPRPQVPEFNIHEFINATPSPRRGTPLGTPGRTSNLGLRADVGRKLFEEEQMRMSQGKIPQPSPERSLGASIDLVQG